MNQRYKLILSTEDIYKEISLPVEKNKISIGTKEKKDIRLYQADFNDEIDLELEYFNDTWQMMCGSSQYMSVDDISKLIMLELKHGQKCSLRSQKTETEICEILCVIDFDYEVKQYDCVLNIKPLNQFSIGSQADCNIVLLDANIVSERVDFINYGSELQLNVKSADYGICHNGNPILGNCRIKNTDFFSIGQFSFYYRGGQLFLTNAEHLMIHGIESLRIKESSSSLQYPKFNRNTRLDIELPEKKLEILDPPTKPVKSDEKLISHILPSVIMLVLIIAVRGSMASNLSYVLFSACSMGVGIFTSIGSYFSKKKDYETAIVNREEEYNAYIARKRQEFEEARQEEARILNQKYIDTDRMVQNIRNFSGELFDRNVEDPDFLKVRLGVGERKAAWPVKYTEKEKISQGDDLAKLPQMLSQEFENVKNVPIICDLLEAHNVGIIGTEDARYQMVKTFTLDLCSHHYYKDVKLFFVFKEERKKQLSWLRFLPHLKGEAAYARNIVCDEESKTYHFEWLYKELCYREALGKNVPNQHIVVFLVDDMGIKDHPISKYFHNAHTMNVHFISFEEKRELLPMYCGQMIEMDNKTEGILIQTNDYNTKQSFAVDEISDRTMAEIALKLAPVYCGEISLESALTKNISLFQLLHIFSVRDLDLKARWESQDICETMAAPIGVKSKNEILFLDLHEKADGPHGLVAGTTGSGKSEIMQTYILSMATLFSPYEVAFMIIDFKGGGMVNQFRNLPHLIGAITDIDGKEINRSLLSIRAELDRRKELFAQAEVNNIASYIKKYKANQIDVPLPHLIILVDEFAELKAEQPEFMKELISASRIGRSLGVHLILATQKPAGQVSDQIWSNSRFRLCLKVQTREDSNEVIKSPLAAEIVEPGRAYLQVGNNEIFELFQSAYSGAPEKSNTDLIKGKNYYISQIDLSGRRRKIFEQKTDKKDTDSITQLESIVNYIDEYCRKNTIKKLAPICLPPLSEILDYPEMAEANKDSANIKIDIGVYDAPENQYQGPVSLGITGQNTIIIGSAQYGKSNLLQVIIRGLAEAYSPKEVNIYILDFGSMIFRNYEKLNHIGGVVYSFEEEKCKNLFKLLNQEMAKRKEVFAQIGVSSFAAYKEAGFEDLAQIVLIVDNLTAMRELYLMEQDFLLPVCRDGVSLGISVIVANSQTSGIGYKYLSNFEQRLCFTCNDNTEYNTVFSHCRIAPSAIPGRCLIELDKTIYEAQTYLSFSGKKEYDRVLQIKSFVEQCNKANEGKRAKGIPYVPEILLEEEFYHQYNCHSDKNQFLFGLDYKTVEPIGIDWMNQSVLAISGSQKKNKTMFLVYMLKVLQEIQADVYILDDYSGAFEQIADADCVSLYSRSVEDVGEILEDIRMELQERASVREEEGVQAIREQHPIVFLIQNQDAITSISSDKKILTVYKDIMNKYKGLKSCIIFTNMENSQIPFSAPEVLKQMKENRQFLIFDNLNEVKLFDCPTSLLKKYKKPLENGEAYLLSGNELSKVKVVSLL